MDTYHPESEELLRSIAEDVSSVAHELSNANLARQLARKRVTDVYRSMPWWKKFRCTPERLARTARMMDIAADIYVEDLSSSASYLDPAAKSRDILKGVRSS